MQRLIKQLPKFSTINYSTIEKQLDQLIQENLTAIDSLVSKKLSFDWDNLMAPLDALEDKLNKFWSPISHLNAVRHSSELRKIYNNCLPKLSDYATQVSHNKALYDAIMTIHDSTDFDDLNAAQQQVLKHNIRDFKLAGVALAADKKTEFAKLCKELTSLNAKFEENVLDATEAWTHSISDEGQLSGLHPHHLQMLQGYAKRKNQSGWLITLEPPCYSAIMTYADNRELRRLVYTAYNTRASDQGPNAGQWDNTSIMYDILKIRLKLAKILGFKNYAERSLATKMVNAPHDVIDFLNQLVKPTLPKAKAEFDALTKFANESLALPSLEAWDVAYASEKLRTRDYEISQEELRPYFPETIVLEGLFTIVSKLYNVVIKPIDDVDVWHPDVKMFAITDANDKLISAFYLDLYAREGKRGGAWMDECLCRRKLTTGAIQPPVAYVVCNFSGPLGDKPALFTHDEVVTLFHEFGHALQHMLTHIDYAEVSGINGIPWDAVEVASQFMENFTWEKPVLDVIAQHYETQSKLSDTLYQRMLAAKNFNAALFMLRQIEFALFDFCLHLNFDPTKPVSQIQDMLNAVRQEVCVVPIPEFNRFQHGFSHIFAGGYAAGYYSYKWAEVMACDAFALFKENGLFNAKISQKFLQTILASGGAVDFMQSFIAFRGREPDVTALLEDAGIVKHLGACSRINDHG